MAYGMTSANTYEGETQAEQREVALDKGMMAGASSMGGKAALSGAGQGAGIGATIGTAVLPGLGTAIGALSGAFIGGVAGYLGGSTAGAKQGRQQAMADLDAKRRSDILARQTKTAMQQEAKANSGPGASTVKAPSMGAVSGVNAAMQAMPSTSGKGTAYDSWRSTVYGG